MGTPVKIVLSLEEVRAIERLHQELSKVCRRYISLATTVDERLRQAGAAQDQTIACANEQTYLACAFLATLSSALDRDKTKALKDLIKRAKQQAPIAMDPTVAKQLWIETQKQIRNSLPDE